jgi:cobalt-zinc-cadmium resistance protein CzcA
LRPRGCATLLTLIVLPALYARFGKVPLANAADHPAKPMPTPLL